MQQDPGVSQSIGFRYADCAVKRAGSNMNSASDHPEVVEQYLATEVKLGRVILLDREALPACQVSHFGPRISQGGGA